MKNRIHLSVVILAVVVVGSISSGSDARWYGGGRGVGVGMGMGMPMGMGGGVGTAFSAAENARAETIRAQGEFNVMNTAAMSNYEDARSKYIDNQEKWTQVYAEKQRALATQKAANRETALATRERAKEFTASHTPSGPPRLASSQLDPTSGRIQWPTALSAVAFEGQRKSLDALFELRAHSSTNPDLGSKVDKISSDMKDSLRKQIRDIPARDYLEARRFLDSLVVEAHSAVG